MKIFAELSFGTKSFVSGYPLNFYGLCFLTVAMACNVGAFTAMVAASGLGFLVAQAAVITALLVTGLTLRGCTIQLEALGGS